MSEADNEYERQRQENILKNKQLLQQLQLDAGSLKPTRGGSSAASSRKSATPTPSKKRSKPVKKEEPAEPVIRRTSSRLAGLPAEHETAKRRRDEYELKLIEAERVKKMRVAGDLSFEIKQGLLDGVKKGTKWGRTFTEEDVKATTDKDVKRLREKMMGLKLYERFTPNEIKITPERIYHLSFHPTTDKQLIFAGDKIGNLGIFDASTSIPDPDADADEEDSASELASTCTYKIHTRTISTFTWEPDTATSLYTSSYDGSIRKFDLSKGVATEVHIGEDSDSAYSGVEFLDNNTIVFSTLEGVVGRKDLRTNRAEHWELHDKKIGGMSLHPRATHLLATASLDRTVKIWDLRQITGKGIFGSGANKLPALLGSHESRLSVSCALWNSSGTLATTSYDDTVKLYKFPTAHSWSPGTMVLGTSKIKSEPPTKNEHSDDDSPSLPEITPTTLIPHNNQTGRWVTILRAQWQSNPASASEHKFVIANMARYLDIYNGDGVQLAQLSHEDVTAVPAAAMFHQSMDWVAGGTASGKVALWA